MRNKTLKILHIEDDKDYFLLIRTLLARIPDLRCSIDLEESSDGAINALQENRYDIYLLDYHLPEHNGLQILKKAVAGGCTRPIIMLTASDGDIDIKAIKSGAADYLHKKGLTASLLERSIRYALERKRAEEQMRESEQKYRSLFNRVVDPILIFSKKTSRFLDCNESALQKYGYSLAELKRMTPPDLHPEDELSTVKQNLHERNVNVANMYTHLTKAGKKIRVEILSDEIEYNGRPAWISIARDVTERERTFYETELLLSSISSILIGVGTGDKITRWNSAAEKTFEISAQEVIGQPFTKSGLNASWLEVLQAIEEIRDKKTVTRLDNVSYTRPDGIRGILRVTINPVAEESHNGGFLVLAEDISERKKAEERTRLVQTIAQEIRQSPDIPSALRVTISKICEATGWSYGEAWLPSYDKKLLEFSPATQYGSDGLSKFEHLSEETSFSIGKGLPGRVWHSKQPEWVPDICKHSDALLAHAEIARKAGFLAGVGVPIIADDEVFAVLVFFILKERAEDRELVELISATAVQIGPVLKHKQVEERLRLQSAALEAAANAIVITDCSGRIDWVNSAFTVMTGYDIGEVVGQTPALLNSSKHDPVFYKNLWETIRQGEVWHDEIVNKRKDGSIYTEEMTITPVRDENGDIHHYIAIKQDITGRKNLERQLSQAQKLESIGQLAAGIAHEINTPIQYVGDNTRFLGTAFERLKTVLDKNNELIKAARENTIPDGLISEAEAVIEESQMDYMVQEIPSAIEETLGGVERVTTIVRAMKEFSHPGTEEKSLTDINKALENTLTVAHNEWKYVADIVKEFDDTIPLVPCHSGELNQVFLNLIVNAAHAIADAIQDSSDSKGLITVSTASCVDWVEIRVRDSGMGIPEEIGQKIFDPFFTTKEVGKGTGQGLAIAHNVVVGKHNGSLDFETEAGKGTTFIIRLPLGDDDVRRKTNEEENSVC